MEPSLLPAYGLNFKRQGSNPALPLDDFESLSK